MHLHPEVLRTDGKNQFVVLPYEATFEALQEVLRDAEDLLGLRRARGEDPSGPGLTIQEARRQLGSGEP